PMRSAQQYGGIPNQDSAVSFPRRRRSVLWWDLWGRDDGQTSEKTATDTFAWSARGGDAAGWRCPPQKMYPSLMRPPSPGDNHDVAHQGLMFSRREILQEADAYGRWPERLLGIPEFQDRARNVVVRGCSS